MQETMTHILKSERQPLITAFTALKHPMPTLINVSDSLIPKRQETIRILKKRSLGIEAMAKLNSVRTQAQLLGCNHLLCLFSSPWVAMQCPRRQLKPVAVPKTQWRAGHPQPGEEFRYMDMSHTASLVLRTSKLTHFIYELDKTTEDSDAIIKSWLM